MHDRDKLAKLFDAALQQTDSRDLSGTAVLPHAWQSQAQMVQPEISRRQEEYARQIAWQRQAAEQQRLAEEQQRVQMLHQAYEQQQEAARRQAWEQHQAALRQQEWERQQAIIRRQEWERQQAILRQQDWERRQALATPHPEVPRRTAPEAEIPRFHPQVIDDGELLSAAEIGGGFFTPKPAAIGTPPQPATTEPAGFVFLRPGEDGGMTESMEFNSIMEARMTKTRRKHGRSFLFTLLLVGVPLLGGTGWFVSDPGRVDALRRSTTEIRSAGDVTSILSTYDKSLDKVAVRGDQLDAANSMLGADPAKETGGDDTHFDAEMRALTGDGGGPTVTERNNALRETSNDVKSSGLSAGAKP